MRRISPAQLAIAHTSLDYDSVRIESPDSTFVRIRTGADPNGIVIPIPVLDDYFAGRVRAVGSSHFPKAGATVTPDGGSEMSANGVAPLGMLIGQLDSRQGAFIKFGSNGRFTAERNGRLKRPETS